MTNEKKIPKVKRNPIVVTQKGLFVIERIHMTGKNRDFIFAKVDQSFLKGSLDFKYKILFYLLIIKCLNKKDFNKHDLG